MFVLLDELGNIEAEIPVAADHPLRNNMIIKWKGLFYRFIQKQDERQYFQQSEAVELLTTIFNEITHYQHL